jgi:signal transduction histidine kinase
MFNAIRATLKAVASRLGGRPDRASILLPFLIIAIGLGALAWRSYHLSFRMERGVKTLAGHYAGYAAEITATRVDAAVRGEMARVADDWQQVERRMGEPNFTMLSEWIKRYDWIVSAIYLPDYDPASSIYGAEDPNVDERLPEAEFYTSTGTVSYTYDPQRLLAKVHSVIRQQPLTPKALPANAIQPQADVSLVQNVREEKLEQAGDGFAFTAKLSAPLDNFGVRALVRTMYVGGRGWENQRVMSLWLSFLALVLMGVGAVLALRGMHKEAETMALRGALIANVSHELRTPLSMIRLGAETLKRGKLEEKERAEIEDQILREVLLLSHLVENVLDIARIQNRNTKALAFTPVYPQDLIENLIATYESWIRSKGFEVVLTLDEEVEEQMWDRDAVSRALLNLVDNAIKYSADERTIDVVLRQTDQHVIIEVIDHGIGIESKDAAMIFEPYYRARFSDTITRRGAGLGLTLVQQIVESHGGKVEVESSLGAGSTFRLLFPRTLEDAEPVSEKPDAVDVVTRGTENYA